MGNDRYPGNTFGTALSYGAGIILKYGSIMAGIYAIHEDAAGWVIPLLVPYVIGEFLEISFPDEMSQSLGRVERKLGSLEKLLREE